MFRNFFSFTNIYNDVIQHSFNVVRMLHHAWTPNHICNTFVFYNRESFHYGRITFKPSKENREKTSTTTLNRIKKGFYTVSPTHSHYFENNQSHRFFRPPAMAIPTKGLSSIQLGSITGVIWSSINFPFINLKRG